MGERAHEFPSSQIIKDHARVVSELSQFLRNEAHLFRFEDAGGKAGKARYIFRAAPSAYSAAIFIMVPIDDEMATVFDVSAAPIDGKKAFGHGFFRHSTGYAISGFPGLLASFLIREFPFNGKSLPYVREAQVIVEFGRGPDRSDFERGLLF